MVSISDATALRLAKAAAAMRAAPVPADRDMAFMARALVLATLPHRDPGDLPHWQRKNGRFTLTIRPHVDAAGRARYPYGSIPRLLLFWIVTEAARTKQRRLELGRSMADFMRQVGLDPATGGGRRGDAHRLRDQLTRLFRAHISFDEAMPPPAQGMRWLNMAVADMGEIWWSVPAPHQAALFGSYVILGEAFFQAITSKPVPVDRRALRELRGSPMALDVYAWATYRAYSLLLARKPRQFIPWACLQEQMGAAYADIGNFRKAFKLALRKVAAVYPALGYRDVTGGLVLLPSLPAVRPQQPGKALLVHGETVPPANRPAARPRGVIPNSER